MRWLPLIRASDCLRGFDIRRVLVTVVAGTLPAIFPCSQSTHTHSNPALTITLDRLPPGSICHAPKEVPEFVSKAFCNRLAFFMIEAMTVNLGESPCVETGSANTVSGRMIEKWKNSLNTFPVRGVLAARTERARGLVLESLLLGLGGPLMCRASGWAPITSEFLVKVASNHARRDLRNRPCCG
jgi:hypothetical protein